MSQLFGRRLALEFVDANERGIDLSEMSVVFEVVKSKGKQLNYAHVRAFNLSPSTIAKIDEQFRRLRIDAGYEGRFGRIFVGDVTNVFTRHEGPDRITDIWAKDGARRLREAVFAMTLNAGTTLHQTLQATSRSFLLDAFTVPRDVPDQTLSGAQTFTGRTADFLDDLARSYDLEWSFQDDQLEVRPRGAADGSTPIEVNRETGLVGAPTASLKRFEFTSLLNPALRPSGTVFIESAATVVEGSEKQLSRVSLEGRTLGVSGGPLTIHEVTHTGETRGQAWYSRVTCKKRVQTREEAA